MNQSQAIDELVRAGWKEYGLPNNLGWKHFFMRHGYMARYVTVFKNGRIVDGLVRPKKLKKA